MGISAAEKSRRIQKITKSQLHQKVTELVERDENRELRKAKINEFEFGLTPSYKKIGKYRSDAYAFTKHNQNPLAGYGNVDLIRSGATVNSLFPIRSGEGYIFDSGNSLWGDLQERYGSNIAGLNQKTFNKIQKDIYAPDLVRYIKSLL